MKPEDFQTADFGTLMRVTRMVIGEPTDKNPNGMTEEQAQAWREGRCWINMPHEITVRNRFEAWRLIHRLRSKRHNADIIGELRVASSVSTTTLRKYYRSVKD